MLIGTFRWLVGANLRFCELPAIEPEKDGLVMRLKQFHPGLLGWGDMERSIEFALVRLREREAVYIQRRVSDPPWLIYRLSDAGALDSSVEKEDVAVRRAVTSPTHAISDWDAVTHGSPSHGSDTSQGDRAVALPPFGWSPQKYEGDAAILGDQRGDILIPPSTRRLSSQH
jgi:hypothetical protein